MVGTEDENTTEVETELPRRRPDEDAMRTLLATWK
jgi:hypothetical protein